MLSESETTGDVSAAEATLDEARTLVAAMAGEDFNGDGVEEFKAAVTMPPCFTKLIEGIKTLIGARASDGGDRNELEVRWWATAMTSHVARSGPKWKIFMADLHGFSAGGVEASILDELEAVYIADEALTAENVGKRSAFGGALAAWFHAAYTTAKSRGATARVQLAFRALNAAEAELDGTRRLVATMTGDDFNGDEVEEFKSVVTLPPGFTKLCEGIKKLIGERSAHSTGARSDEELLDPITEMEAMMSQSARSGPKWKIFMADLQGFSAGGVEASVLDELEAVYIADEALTAESVVKYSAFGGALAAWFHAACATARQRLAMPWLVKRAPVGFR